jgi:hypothetical protein
MKKRTTFLIMVALLSLAPAVFAANDDLPAYNPGASHRVSSAASNVPRQADRHVSQPAASDVSGQTASDTTRDADQDWQAGELRQPGEYMGPDGVYHHVPKLQDPRMKIY